MKSSDAPAVKRLKLAVLSHLVNADNVLQILGELQLYATDVDQDLVSQSIRVIGACAQRQSQITPDCLGVLTGFLSSTTGTRELLTGPAMGLTFIVYADSTVTQALLVLKVLLPQLDSVQTRLKTISTLVQHLHAQRIRDPSARSVIYWLAGQFAEDGVLHSFGPDVLRFAAKTFPDEVSGLLVLPIYVKA